ncbi:MAG: hypothetical protein HGA97_02860 [Chlorobiaceae bacterium]|nr:hypothetical protein [Chlorobiaceae bacterium]
MKIPVITPLTTLLFLGQLNSAKANLIINGDFETLVQSNTTSAGWTSSHIDGAGGWRSASGNPNGMFIINDNGVSTDPTIEQLVTSLTPGATYRLTGNYKNIYGIGSRSFDTFAIDIDGVTLDKIDFPGTSVWGNFSFDIVTPDNDLLIAFRAEIDGDDTDYAIDNISLVQTDPGSPIPEPSALMMLLSGIAVSIPLKNWKKKLYP